MKGIDERKVITKGNLVLRRLIGELKQAQDGGCSFNHVQIHVQRYKGLNSLFYCQTLSISKNNDILM